MYEEIIENIQKDINKQLNKIKPIKKTQQFNKKYKNIIWRNNKLTEIGTYIIFLEMYEITQALLKQGEKI